MSALLRSVAALPVCVGLLLSGALAAAVAPQTGLSGRDLIEQAGIDQRLGEALPLDAELRDEDGATVDLASVLDGQPAILVFAYYECPMLCELVLRGLLQCLKVVDLDAGDGFRVVVISIDPGEGPELARAKRESARKAYGRDVAPDAWRFLTGDEENIAAVAGAAGFHYVYDPAIDEYAHASGILVLTPEGRVSHYFYGIEYPPRDVRLALVEAGRGRIGSLVDRVLLFCYHYDPTSGRYGVAIMRIVRLAGGLTVLALAGGIVLFLRRERRAALAAAGGEIGA